MPKDDGKEPNIKLTNVVALKRNLDNPAKVLKQIGAILVSRSQRTFRDQRLGTFRWPERYPGQKGARINVAGAARDLSKGGQIKKRRFQPRPALTDTGALKRSVNSQAVLLEGKFTVSLGSALSYAAKHQFGGTSKLPVTETTKKNLAKFLKKKSNREKFASLGFLFQRTELSTKINRRPFVGVTAQDQEDIVRIVEGNIPGKQTGRV